MLARIVGIVARTAGFSVCTTIVVNAFVLLCHPVGLCRATDGGMTTDYYLRSHYLSDVTFSIISIDCDDWWVQQNMFHARRMSEG